MPVALNTQYRLLCKPQTIQCAVATLFLQDTHSSTSSFSGAAAAWPLPFSAAGSSSPTCRNANFSTCNAAAHSASSASPDPFGHPPQLPQRRVVVTGMGMVTPLGVGLHSSWQRLLEGGTGVRRLQADDLPEVCTTAMLGTSPLLTGTHEARTHPKWDAEQQHCESKTEAIIIMNTSCSSSNNAVNMLQQHVPCFVYPTTTTATKNRPTEPTCPSCPAKWSQQCPGQRQMRQQQQQAWTHADILHSSRTP